MKKALVLTLVIAALLPQINAGAATATKNVSGTIKGTFAAPVSGACSTGYAAECPSNNCVSVVPVGTPTGSGTIGKGTASAMCVTVDMGLAVDNPSDQKSTCAPFFGTLTYTGSKSGISATVNMTGAYCHHQATSTTDSLGGGFGIPETSDDVNARGWGTATGTVNKGTGAFSLKISGSFTP